MKSKICIVIPNVFSYAGTENICNFMTNSLGDEYDITIVSLNGNGNTFYPFSKAKKIISLEGKKLKVLRSVFLSRKYGEKGTFIISMGKLSVLFAFFSKITFNNLSNVIACEHVSINSFSWKIKKIKLFFLKKYSKVVTLTDRDFDTLFREKIKAIRIYNPIFPKKHFRDSRSHVAVAIGRLDHQKGFDRLLEIWSIFIKRNPNWLLHIAGEGELREILTDSIEKLRLQNSVKLLGKINDVDNLYKNADIFLMTSRYEGLPMVLLEAKAWCLPTISYDCQTGPREVINDGVDGFLIDDGNHVGFTNAMNELAVDDNKYYEMSHACNITIEKFSAEIISNEWKKLANSMSA